MSKHLFQEDVTLGSTRVELLHLLSSEIEMHFAEARRNTYKCKQAGCSIEVIDRSSDPFLAALWEHLKMHHESVFMTTAYSKCLRSGNVAVEPVSVSYHADVLLVSSMRLHKMYLGWAYVRSQLCASSKRSGAQEQTGKTAART